MILPCKLVSVLEKNLILVCLQGEEDKGANMERFVVQLAGLADVYVNDAFGSWQPHASTYHITKYLPSYAGLCMQVLTTCTLSPP